MLVELLLADKIKNNNVSTTFVSFSPILSVLAIRYSQWKPYAHLELWLDECHHISLPDHIVRDPISLIVYELRKTYRLFAKRLGAIYYSFHVAWWQYWTRSFDRKKRCSHMSRRLSFLMREPWILLAVVLVMPCLPRLAMQCRCCLLNYPNMIEFMLSAEQFELGTIERALTKILFSKWEDNFYKTKKGKTCCLRTLQNMTRFSTSSSSIIHPSIPNTIDHKPASTNFDKPKKQLLLHLTESGFNIGM